MCDSTIEPIELPEELLAEVAGGEGNGFDPHG